MSVTSCFSVRLAVIGGVLAFYQVIVALAAQIPFKIDVETAQRRAAEAVYGVDAEKYLDYFDYDEKLDRFF